MIGLIDSGVDWLWIPIVFGLVTAAIVVLLGIPPLRLRRTVLATVTEVFAHTFGGLAILFGAYYGAYFLVPRYLALTDDFRIDLTGMTKVVMQVSGAITRLPLLALSLLVAMLVCDAAVFHVLHKTVSTRTIARIWSGCLTAVIAIGMLSSVAAIVGTLIKIVIDHR